MIDLVALRKLINSASGARFLTLGAAFLEEHQEFEEKPARGGRLTLKIIVSACLILIVLMASALVNMNYEVGKLNSQLDVLAAQNQNLTRQLNALQQRGELLESQVAFYRNQTEYYQRQLERESAQLGVTGESTVNIVAVKETPLEAYTASYEGVVMGLDVELRAGEGRILINTQPRIGIDLQTSAQTAAIVAESYTGVSLEKTDIIITVKAEEAVSIVDGPSAGAAITAAIISAILNQTLTEEVYITGTINPDGSIGKVGGILYKATAAAEKGATKFLVPPGQSTVAVYVEEKKELAPGFLLIVTRQEMVDLQSYLQEHGYTTEVLEVQTITDAYPILRG